MFRGLRVSRVLLLNIVLCLTIAAPNLMRNKRGGGGSTQCPSGYVILLQLIIWYLYQIQPALLREVSGRSQPHNLPKRKENTPFRLYREEGILYQEY